MAGAYARRTDAPRTRFQVIDGQSAVLIEARSNVGPIAFGTTCVTGYIEVGIVEGALAVDGAVPQAHLELDMRTFASGNSVYDAELSHRIDARRFPTAALDLGTATRIGRSERYRVDGDLSFHGVTRQISGSVEVGLDPGGQIRVTGEHMFDIRDFDIAAPSVLMLRIYPDVRIQLELTAEVIA